MPWEQLSRGVASRVRSFGLKPRQNPQSISASVDDLPESKILTDQRHRVLSAVPEIQSAEGERAADEPTACLQAPCASLASSRFNRRVSCLIFQPLTVPSLTRRRFSRAARSCVLPPSCNIGAALCRVPRTDLSSLDVFREPKVTACIWDPDQQIQEVQRPALNVHIAIAAQAMLSRLSF